MVYTEVEYSRLLAELDQKYIQDKKDLIRKVVTANNPHKIKGLVLSDQFGSIQLVSWGVGMIYGNKLPQAVYKGFELKKDGTIRKDRKMRTVYQRDLI